MSTVVLLASLHDEYSLPYTVYRILVSRLYLMVSTSHSLAKKIL